MKMKSVVFSVFSLLAGFTAFSVFAGQAETAHWGGFPAPVGPVGEVVTDTYNFIYYITAVVAIFVEAVILWCIWRFRKKNNPKAAKFSHNIGLEVVWTAIPVLICLAISWKSFEAMYFIRTMPEEGMDVEVIAYQFGWDFDYPDLQISSPMPEAPHVELSAAGMDRYVKRIVVPVDINVRLHVTARDVIHAVYVPTLGIKIDAIPGRINYQWFRADKTGEYIGQCAELCGSAHGEMYFSVKVVSQGEYRRWVNKQRSSAGLPLLNDLQFAALFGTTS